MASQLSREGLLGHSASAAAAAAAVVSTLNCIQASARLSRTRVLPVRNAFKKPVVQPPIITPEEKTLQSMVETGIRGTIAMAAAYTFHLNLFTHMHLDASHIITGIQAAAPCLAMESLLLLVSSTLPAQPLSLPPPPAAAAVDQQQQTEPSSSSSTGNATLQPLLSAISSTLGSDKLTANTVQEAVDAVYLHNMRYSLIGATAGARRLLLEAGAQLSDDLLARGVLLCCSTAWLTSRFTEAGVCEQPLLLAGNVTPAAGFCSHGIEWLAAGAICCMIASRYNFHSNSSTSNLQDKRNAAEAAAAVQRKLLRYEPKAVQDKVAAAAAAAVLAHSADGGLSLSASPDGQHENDELVSKLVHGWLGARFIVGQAAMFAAFIATDNLLASFVAGLAMQLVSNACCEQHLRQSIA